MENKTSTPKKMEAQQIMEITTFNIQDSVSALEFAKLDKQVESNFTSKQAGFIKRQSSVNENGEYLVVVYWESTKDADQSMQKFMSDPSVASYAQMINPSTMKMTRYTMDTKFDAPGTQFIELMSFAVNENTDMEKFDITNHKVETEFTAMRKGFLQRLTGKNDEGRHVVAVYWTNKNDSDASLNAFMEAPIAKEFMKYMDSSSISMGRYNFLDQ